MLSPAKNSTERSNARITLIWVSFLFLGLPLFYFAVAKYEERSVRLAALHSEVESLGLRTEFYQLAYAIADYRRNSVSDVGNEGLNAGFYESDELNRLLPNYPQSHRMWNEWLRDKFDHLEDQEFAAQIETVEHLLSITELLTKEAQIGANLSGREYTFVDLSEKVARMQEQIAQLRGFTIVKASYPEYAPQIETIVSSLHWTIQQKQKFLSQEFRLLTDSGHLVTQWNPLAADISRLLETQTNAEDQVRLADGVVDQLLAFREGLDWEIERLTSSQIVAIKESRTYEIVAIILLLIGGGALAHYLANRIRIAEADAVRIAEREYLYRVAVDNAMVGVFDRPDIADETMYWSKELRTLLKYKHDVEPIPLISLVHSDDRPQVLNLRESLFQKPGTKQIQARCLCGDGQYRWFGVNAVSNVNEQTGKLRLSGTFFSLDEVKEVEKLKRQETDLKRSLFELSKANADLDQFAHMASHDLQEPLRMVTNFMELLEDECKGDLQDEALEYIRFAKDGASRMQTLLDDLLEYARVDQAEIELVPTDISVLAERVLDDLADRVASTGAVVRYENLPTVLVDQVGLQRVLQNLISNAIKYQPEGQIPRISIEVSESAEHWQLKVSDNGIGIDTKQRSSIFQPFKRLHGKGDYSGNGIGLAIVHKIVTSWQGSIEVTSSELGSCFCLTVPQSEYRLVRGAA